MSRIRSSGRKGVRHRLEMPLTSFALLPQARPSFVVEASKPTSQPPAFARSGVFELQSIEVPTTQSAAVSTAVAIEINRPALAISQ